MRSKDQTGDGVTGTQCVGPIQGPVRQIHVKTSEIAELTGAIITEPPPE